jgi:type IV pilus assembly protein PilN
VGEIQAEVGRRQDLTIAGIALGVTLLLVLLVYVFQGYRLSQLNREIASLKNEVEILNVQVKGVEELRQKIAALKGKLEVIDELNQKKTGPVRLMEGLTTAAPARLWLMEFKETGGDLTLSGMAVDNQTVAEFLKALARLPYFRNVELVEAAQIEQDGIPLKKFSLRANVVYQPLQPNAPATSQGGKTG